MEDLRELLKAHRFFEDFDDPHLDLLTSCAHGRVFTAGSYLCREGAEARLFYLVRSGKVAVEIFVPRRGAVTLQTVGEGEIFGWSWLVPPYQYDFDARAIEQTRVIVLDGERLREYCEADPAMGYTLLKRFSGIMVERLRHARWQLLELHGVEK
jgi:CRP-like cAMP-binding protein